MMRAEVVYIGHDNSIDLVLLSDGVPVALAALTRVRLVLGAVTVDSATEGFGAGQPFDATVSGSWQGQAVDVLRLSLGGLGLIAGQYTARLVTFDGDHPNGLVWTESLPVVVKP